jgi:hypothetical protein
MSGSKALAPPHLPPCSFSGCSTASSPRDPPRRCLSRSHPAASAPLTLMKPCVAADQHNLSCGSVHRPLARLAFSHSSHFLSSIHPRVFERSNCNVVKNGRTTDRKEKRRSEESDGTAARRRSRRIIPSTMPLLTFFATETAPLPHVLSFGDGLSRRPPRSSILVPLSLFFPSLFPPHPPHLSPRRR